MVGSPTDSMYNTTLIRVDGRAVEAKRRTLPEALTFVANQVTHPIAGLEYHKAFVAGTLADGSWYIREVDLKTLTLKES